MMKQFDNEDASAGSMIGSIVCIAIVGTVFWVLGQALDVTIGVTNNMVALFMISQDAANTIYMLAVVFAALPFMYLLAVIVNYWSTASDESSGGV
jgi:hypothetical protein